MTFLTFILLFILTIILFIIITKIIFTKLRQPKELGVTILVLGDIGRSPRMEFHAIELSQICPVNIICYEETKPLKTILENKNIKIFPLKTMKPLKAMPLRFIIWICFYGPLKFLYLFFQILKHLLISTKPYSHILIQNPPSMPSFLTAAIAKFFTNCNVVVDWHNTAYSIVMNVNNKPETNIVIRLLKNYELIIPKYFDYHFTVTKAMKQMLIEKGYKADRITVLYDKPFMNINSSFDQRVELYKRLKKDLPEYSHSFIDTIINNSEKVICGVSSTSWTPDEDFSVLFDALLAYEKSEKQLPKMLIFITGKGPMREMYEKKIEEENMKRVCIVPVWLSHEDYPLVLSSCDFGVSLHQSSSQLDLPMKVLDMFGCSLPVLARGYPCLKDELVVEGEYGYCFDNSDELKDLLLNILSSEEKSQLFFEKMKKNVMQKNNITWAQNWKNEVGPLFLNFKGSFDEKKEK